MTVTPHTSDSAAPSLGRLNGALARFPRAAFLGAVAQTERTSLPEPIPNEALLKKALLALGLTGSERVLELGSRTGYETALLAHLAREVFSITPDPESAAQRAELLRAAGCSNVNVVVGPGKEGWPLAAPYRAIFVAGGATQVPPALLDQLELDGRLVIPLGDASGQLLEFFRQHQDGFCSETLAPCHLAMLPWASRRPSSFPWGKDG